jgi:hypothetical protein
MLTTIAPGFVPEHRRVMTTSPLPIPPAPPSPPFSPPPPAPPLRLPRALRAWARATQIALVACMIVLGVVVGLLLAQRGLLTRLRDDAAATRFSDVLESDDQVRVMNGIWAGLFVVTGIIWLVWWAKAHRAASDGRGDLRYGRGWAIGGWFVPFANLVVPKRVADDLWTASREPRRPRDAGVARSRSVLAWWATYIAAGVLSFTVTGRARTVSDEITQNAVRIVRALVFIVAAALAYRLVKQITDGFAEQAGASPRAPRSTRARTALAGAAVVIVVATVAGSWALFEVEPHTTARGFVAAGDNRRYEPKGEHFSVTVPESWLVLDRDELPRNVSFGAASTDGNTAVTIAEAPAGSAASLDEFRTRLVAQFHVVGDVKQTSVHLPAGDADCLSFTAIAEHLELQARFYVFRGERFDHVVALVTPSDDSAGNAGKFATILQSFRPREGQAEGSDA